MTDFQTLQAAPTRPLPTVVGAALRRRLAAVGLIALMVLGSVALWTAVPLAVLWLAAQMQGPGQQLEALPALVTAAGIPLAMALCARCLAALERRYYGAARPSRVPAHRRSISDTRSAAPATVLDTIMVASALLAVIAFAGWLLGAP